MSTTPRRPLVPSPSAPSISQRAIALREQKNTQSPDCVSQSNGGPPTLAMRPVSPMHLPIDQITTAVAKVMSEIGTIQKTGFNKFHGYHYASMGDVFHAVTPLM